MSFPKGTTPRGLPYPGTTDPAYNVPLYLQALADAVQAQLDSAGTTQPLVSWVGSLTTNGNGYIFPVIPRVRIVRGALVMANTTSGPGAAPYLYFLSPTSWTDQNSWGKAVIGVKTIGNGGNGYPGIVANVNVGVNVLAWGDPM